MRWIEINRLILWLTIFITCTNSKDINDYLKESKKQCWGFEPDCTFNESYSADHIKCGRKSEWPSIRNKAEQIDAFWRAGDFGSLKKTVDSMQVICQSNSDEGSFLECSDHLRFCRGKNIFFDLQNLNAPTSSRYRSDVIEKGQVGGYCDKNFHANLLKTDNQKGYLQSWAMELQHFHSIKSFNFDSCDFVFEKPTFVIKLDASVNMYHHFCDFINLFASQFVNDTFFGRDVDILWWDTYSGGFVDPMFGSVWQAFSTNKPFELVDFDKKKICFRDVTFPLLARQFFGLYYNMPLVDGCGGSGLFHVFSHHLLDRLGVKQEDLLLDKVRVTVLERRTHFRRILNINELLQSLIELPNVKVKVVSYERDVSFIDQLKITHNSDIFIGMHGSGLTHTLFLPDWAAVFELYNCGDEHCYKDLARLRGVKYWTWTRKDKVFPEDEGRHPDSGMPHQKFTNYAFDIAEFKRIVGQMIRQGAWRRAWNNFIGSFYGETVRHKKYMGVDQFGNRFYEYEFTRLNVKRGFDPPENAKFLQNPPPEWKAWLNMTRRFPPTEEEILISQQKHQAQLQSEYDQDAETERRAPKVGSTGRGAGDTDGSTNFPYYEDIEIGPGVKKPSTSYEIEKDGPWKLQK